MDMCVCVRKRFMPPEKQLFPRSLSKGRREPRQGGNGSHHISPQAPLSGMSAHTHAVSPPAGTATWPRDSHLSRVESTPPRSGGKGGTCIFIPVASNLPQINSLLCSLNVDALAHEITDQGHQARQKTMGLPTESQ